MSGITPLPNESPPQIYNGKGLHGTWYTYLITSQYGMELLFQIKSTWDDASIYKVQKHEKYQCLLTGSCERAPMSPSTTYLDRKYDLKQF